MPDKDAPSGSFDHEIGLRYSLDGLRDYPYFTETDHRNVLQTNAEALSTNSTPVA